MISVQCLARNYNCITTVYISNDEKYAIRIYTTYFLYTRPLLKLICKLWNYSRTNFPEQIWLGVTDELVENEWRQTNGDIANITSYTSWWSPEALSKTNTKETNCIAMNTTSYLWERRNCFEKITGGIVCRRVNNRKLCLPAMFLKTKCYNFYSLLERRYEYLILAN